MKKAFNISNQSLKIVELIDNNQFFCLDDKNTNRLYLIWFTIALGVERGYPTSLERGKKSFVRTEYMENILHVFAALYYDKKISTGEEDIDIITDDNILIDLAEEYAETGFSILKDKLSSNVSEENFCFELIAQMDQWIENYFPAQ